jgi:hypothetical protein
MRGLEIVLFMLCVVLAIPLVPVIVPGYNGGNGFDTGSTDFNTVNEAFNWSALEQYKPAEQSSNPVIAVIEQAQYWFNFAVMAITGIGKILFSAITIAPQLLSVFAVNPVLTGVLLSVFAIVLLIAWYQITKGDDWSGRR